MSRAIKILNEINESKSDCIHAVNERSNPHHPEETIRNCNIGCPAAIYSPPKGTPCPYYAVSDQGTPNQLECPCYKKTG